MNLAKIYIVTLMVGAAVVLELGRTVPVFHLAILGAVAWVGSRIFGS